MCRYEDPRGPGRRHLGVRIGQEGAGAVFVEQVADGTVVICAHARQTDGPEADQAQGPVLEFTFSAERWHTTLAELTGATRVKKQKRPPRPPKKAKR